VVVDKPAGLLSVPGRGEDKKDCAAARVQRDFADALVVHRLDMATSGLFLMARGARAQRTLGAGFAAGAVQKRYEALVAGLVEADEGTIELPLMVDWPNRPRQRVDHERGKPSRTRWRVHLQAIGHPILGDALYAPAAVQDRAGRLMLHATRLAFAHPASGEPMSFHSPAPF